MGTFRFSGNARIEIQGTRVLRVRKLFSDRVDFNIVSFDKSVHIEDYRPDTLAAIKDILAGDSKATFVDSFCKPAHSDIIADSSDQIQIELRRKNSSPIDHMLWIAIGLKNQFPVQNYMMRKLIPCGTDEFAVVSLISNVSDARFQSSFSELADSSSVSNPSEPFLFSAGS